MKKGQELVVGIVIILGIAVAVLGTLYLQGTNWGRAVTEVQVLVGDVGQLMEGNDVRFRGVPIGRVDRIRVTEDGEAVRVVLELEGEVAITDEAVAVLAPSSLFGDWQVEIVASRDRYPRFEYYEVPPGHSVDGVRVLGGYTLPDITRLTAAADEIAENMAVLSDRVDRAFSEETAENIVQLIANLEQVSADVKDMIQQQAATFETVSSDVQSAVGEISAAASTLRNTLAHVDTLVTSGDMATILTSLRDASEGLSTLTEELQGPVSSLGPTLTRADSAFARVDRITRQLESGEGTLGMLLTDTTLVSRAQSMMAQIEALMSDIRENPDRYVRLSIF